MSLTDEFEIREMFKKPVKKLHHPNFHGDLQVCNYATGHCTNTMACNDCIVYQSVLAVREYNNNMRGH